MACGLNYFKGDSFRSKMFMEFGVHYQIPAELVELYGKNKIEAISTLLKEIEQVFNLIYLMNYYFIILFYFM